MNLRKVTKSNQRHSRKKALLFNSIILTYFTLLNSPFFANNKAAFFNSYYKKNKLKFIFFEHFLKTLKYFS